MKVLRGANAAVIGMGLLAAACAQSGPPAQETPHEDLFERSPRAAVVGEHGAYNIAWFTLNDSVLLPAPAYEVMVTYHTPRRGPGAVLDKHWAEMRQVALAEIARRCPAPAEWTVLDETRSYDSGERAMGGEIRVVYRCE